MDSATFTAALKDEARRLGFTQTGVCAAGPAPGWERFDQWLQAGYAGQMHYLPERAEAYRHPRSVLDGVRSILMLAMSYDPSPANPPGAGEARVARYAWGTGDYHDVLHARLKSLIAFLKARRPAAQARGVVDTAPLMERELAQLAGLGWMGKNTLLLNKQHGSYFFLAALLTDQPLASDEPFRADHCGTCTACLDACPTAAFPQPYVLDATRCISYLTIELRESIPHDLRSGVGDWLFGCDVCQDVCPWNQRAPATGEPAFAAEESLNAIDAVALFELDDEAFRARFRHTPLWRSKRRGILRNAAIVLGNRPAPRATAALVRGLNDSEPLVRGACAWALGNYGDDRALRALRSRKEQEAEPSVLVEIDAALTADRNPPVSRSLRPTTGL